MANKCPYGPLTPKFSIKRCSICRATTTQGYSCRRIVSRTSKALSLEFPTTSTLNFVCESFTWNFDQNVGDIFLKGVGPLSPDDCEFSQSGTCSKLGISTETRVSVWGQSVKIGGSIPICEVCLASEIFSKAIEKELKYVPREKTL